MKNIWPIVIGILGVIAIMAVAAVNIVNIASKKNDSTERDTFTVTSTASRDVEPDQATIYYYIQSRADIKQDAVDNLQTSTEELKKELESKDLTEDNFDTNSYNVDQDYRYNYIEESEEDNGYMASQSLEVTIDDIDQDRVNDIIASTSGLDDVGVGQVSFAIDDDEKIREELYAEAVEKAQSKAESLVSRTDNEVGKIVTIKDEFSDYGYPEPYYFEATSDEPLEQSISPETISIGDKEVSVRVIVEYELK